MRNARAASSWIVPLALSLALLLTACASGGSLTVAPTVAPVAAPTTAPPTPAEPTKPVVPAAAASTATTAATAGPTTAAKPAGVPTVSAPIAAGSVRLALAGTGSEARYRAREILAGQTAQNEAIGVTRDIAGTLLFGPDGKLVASQSTIIVDLRTLKSDSGMRDFFLQQTTLKTADFPNAVFVASDVTGLDWPLPLSGDVSFKLRGDLTLRGVTRPATWEVKATFTPREVNGSAITAITMADYQIPTPRVPRVASIEDQLQLEFDFKTNRAQG